MSKPTNANNANNENNENSVNLKDPFLQEHNTWNRLVQDFQKHGKLIVAFDFDNTIYDYHDKGYTFNRVIKLLHKCKMVGFELVCFTANEDLVHVRGELNSLGFKDVKINESSVSSNSSKIYYNILLDDRAGLKETFDILTKFTGQVFNGALQLLPSVQEITVAPTIAPPPGPTIKPVVGRIEEVSNKVSKIDVTDKLYHYLKGHLDNIQLTFVEDGIVEGPCSSFDTFLKVCREYKEENMEVSIFMCEEVTVNNNKTYIVKYRVSDGIVSIEHGD
jgi:hypothetical protein